MMDREPEVREATANLKWVDGELHQMFIEHVDGTATPLWAPVPGSQAPEAPEGPNGEKEQIQK